MKAKGSFNQHLEHCLQELSGSDDVEASLRRYPQHADQLRPLLEMAQAARHYYDAVPEAPRGLATGRERLLAVAAEQRARRRPATRAPRTRQGRRKTKLIFVPRLVAVLLAVVVGTAVLGGGVIWAANDSVPGDLLYPVKLTTEDTRLALASTPADQIDLLLQFVERREDEIEVLVEAGRQVPDEAIARMEQHIERALTQAAWATDAEITGLLMRVAERTRTQARALEQLQPMASQQAQAGLARAVTVCQRGAQAAEDGLNDPQAFRRRYHHRQGTPEPTDEPMQLTITSGGDQEWNQERQQQQERTRTPVATLYVTPHIPQVTPSPQAIPNSQPTPHGLGSTPSSSQATAVPQTTRGPQQTPVSPATSPQPPRLGGGQSGGGQTGGEQGGGG